VVANRGFDVESSRSKDALIDAADAILSEEGYHTISARSVASRAGLKPQLVHYYFRTMDDLLIAAFRRSTERHKLAHQRALADRYPLHALWQLTNNSSNTKRNLGFLALGAQREAIRNEIVQASEHFRTLQIEAVTNAFASGGIDTRVYSPAGIALLMAAAARALVTEDALGISLAHAELHAMVEKVLAAIEPIDPPSATE
jgi:AcrR family transcriptional regulator